MEAVTSIFTLIVSVAVLSSLAGRWMTRRRGAQWVWDRSTPIGWLLIATGVILVVYGLVVDGSGLAMSTKLGLGSLLLIAGTWMIW